MRNSVRDIGIGVAVALAFALGAEALVRLAWTPPFDWPLAGGAAPEPHLHIHPLLGVRPRPSWSGIWSWDRSPIEFAVSAAARRRFRLTDAIPPTL